MRNAAWSAELQRDDEAASLSRCRGRYSTGEFKGMGCIERGKEHRHGLPLCRVHAKVFDRWTTFGFDYVRSIVRLEWEQEL
jgi:hypothetical protein